MSVKNAVGIFFRRNIVSENYFKTEFTVRKISRDGRACVMPFFRAVDYPYAFVAVSFPCVYDISAEFAYRIFVVTGKPYRGIIPVKNGNLDVGELFAR